MRIMGALNHYLASSIIIGFIIFCLLKVLEIILKKAIMKEHIGLSLITCIVQFVFVVYLAGVFSVTGGYTFFIDGFPNFFMSPNLIPIVYTIQDIITNPSEMVGQIGYNIALFVPFGFCSHIPFPRTNGIGRKFYCFQ